MDLNHLEYRGVPPELIAEIGMMAIAAAWLDETVYGLGVELGHHPGKLRRGSSRDAVRTILKTLNDDARLPPHASNDITIDAMTDWMQRAKECIEDRNLIIHSSVLMQRQHRDDWATAFLGQRDDGHVRPATATEVRSLRKRIDRQLADSYALRRALLRQLEPGIYVSYFGRGSDA